MKTRSLVFVTILVVAVSSWLSIVFYPSTLDFMGSNPFWNGVSNFGSKQNPQVLPNLNGLADTTPDILVAVPNLRYSDADLSLFQDFVRGGGTLLLLDDYGYGNQVLEALGLDLRFAGTPLLDPYLNYRNPRLPVIDDISPGLKTAGVDKLVFNHATALILPASPEKQYEILARSSDLSYLDAGGDGKRSAGDIVGPLAVAVRTNVGGGTVVAVSDPSILINSMAGLGSNRRFFDVLTSSGGKPLAVAVDASHLPKASLDTAKDAWTVLRTRLAMPWFEVLLVSTAVVLSFIPLWRKGVEIER